MEISCIVAAQGRFESRLPWSIDEFRAAIVFVKQPRSGLDGFAGIEHVRYCQIKIREVCLIDLHDSKVDAMSLFQKSACQFHSSLMGGGLWKPDIGVIDIDRQWIPTGLNPDDFRDRRRRDAGVFAHVDEKEVDHVLTARAKGISKSMAQAVIIEP